MPPDPSAPGGRGMGRGLAAILPSGPRPSIEGLRELPVDLIDPNERQPRRHFDGEALLALSESIRSRGMLQPLVVRPRSGGRYELIAGERRLRAAKLAGHGRVPAIVRDTGDDERLELALIENMAREDLNPVESARACATLVDDLGLSKEELARRVGRSRAAVSNLIRLLALPDEALTLIESGRLSEGHGRALLVCKDNAERRALAKRAAAEGWTVRETERRARAAEDPAQPSPSGVVLHPDLADALGAAEDALQVALGREVRVRPAGDGCRVEFRLESPSDGVELAEQLLRRSAAA